MLALVIKSKLSINFFSGTLILDQTVDKFYIIDLMYCVRSVLIERHSTVFIVYYTI